MEETKRQKEYISTTEAAEILGISRVAVFKRIKSGKLPAEKVGRNYVIERSEVLEGGEDSEAGFNLSYSAKEKLKELEVAVVYLFGSRASGRFLETSDMDLGIVMMDPEDSLENIADIHSKVYAVLSREVPSDYGGKLDIAFLQSANAALSRVVLQEGKVLFEESPKVRADFEEGVIRKYDDYFSIQREYEDANVNAFV